MHRFYVEHCSDAEKSITIYGEDAHHIRNVLRLRAGEEIIISDGGSRDYICSLSLLENDRVVADIVDICDNSAELPVRITLFQGMPKADKMELIIQKAVELGAASIVPVMTKRTVVKLEPKKELRKLERFQSIAESAAKQSGRGVIPKVQDFMNFREAVDLAASMDMVLIPYEEARGMEYARQVIDKIKDKKSLGIFIGPEGGFAKEEVEYAIQKGAKCITLGNRILRTETAGMAILSIIMFALDK
jgi:16S rRNA (uracil1498-N3)-methyltransferase